MILLDTSGLLSAIDGSQRHRARCADALSSAAPPLLLSPFVLAEIDYLLAKHVGAATQRSLLEEIGRGAYRLEPFGAAVDAHCAAEQYEGLRDRGHRLLRRRAAVARREPRAHGARRDRPGARGGVSV